MAAPNGMMTYQDTLRREDLMDLIADVSPDANYLTTTLGTSEASQTLHEWSEYYLSRETSITGTIEGDDASFSDLQAHTRKSNVTGIIRNTFAVTETDIAVSKVNPQDAYAREMGYAMRQWKNKHEFAVLRGSYNSGASGVARMMRGIRNEVATNGLASFFASGTSLTEARFNTLELSSYNVTDEYMFDLVLTTGQIKQTISGFTAGFVKTVNPEDKRLVKSVTVYEGDFGMHEIRAHKDMPTGEILGLRKELCKVAYLRRPKHTELSKTGSSKKGMIESESTVEVRSARPMVLVQYIV